MVLTGARQTGKTTLLRELFPDHHYVSLDLPADAALAEENPSKFLSQYPAPVIIDEVQYAPKLFRYLKIRIDENRESNGQYILTGSQKFNLMKGVSDSLAGRCGLLELEALSRYELGEVLDNYIRDESLEHVLVRGFMPQLWKDRELTPRDFFTSYLATYIERDVRQLINITSLRDFDRFMRACAIRTGQLLNKTEIAKDVGVSSKTVNQWLSVLEASNQITLLEPYFYNIGKRLVKSPKIYFNDVGLLTFLLGLNEVSILESYLIGSIWETFLFSEIRKSIRAVAPEATIWFYRDQSREVDFIFERGMKPKLIDAKWKEYPGQKDFKKLNEAHALFKNPHSELYIFCRTPNNFPVGENNIAVNGLNVREALL